MSSKLPTTARHLSRQPSRRLTPQRYLLTAPPNDALRGPQLLRHPPSLVDLTSQLTPEHEAYYGSILLHAVLNSNGHTTFATHSHVLNSSHVDPASPEPEPSPPPERVSDEEWEIRTGRAIYILEKTLPDFFQTGLVSSLDLTTGEPSSTQKSWSLVNPTDTWHTIKDKLTAKSKEDCNEAPAIYSPRVRLTYTPPTPLPAPFPKTLHAEGLHLYIASSIFVRHTLNALYTDLVVDITRARVNNGGTVANGGTTSGSETSRFNKSRERSVAFGLMVTGIGRVSGTRTEWEINCTYTFSPLTGLIIHHSVDSIEPAPHQALFEALGKFGLLDGGVGPKPGNVGS
ncbi:hypothetical protein BC629DRAFT_1593421 [Irpex lacteus]|nr:hypothetical protein BC629DRAFT_1593421 [Irpex lacteus]